MTAAKQDWMRISCRSLGIEVFRLGEVLAELFQRCVDCSLRDSLASANHGDCRHAAV